MSTSPRENLLVLSILALGIFAAYNWTGAPPQSASGDRFSLPQALGELGVIAARPHPIGSPEKRAVRDYLLSKLKGLGLEAQVQEETLLRLRGSLLQAARVENVVGMLKGTPGGDAVLLAAHYDSVPAAPGAGDDGAGVAAILEVLRTLPRDPPPRNDVIVLLSDAEESGLWGARAFVERHPWADRVRVAFNFEGRGSSGQSQLFETSPGNARLVEWYAETAPYPSGNSLSYEIYRRMPNDTDFTWFKRAGFLGLNFAFIDGFERYHSARDDLENLDPTSLLHHGINMQAMLRDLAFADLDALEGTGDAVFFSVLGRFVHYRWSVPFSLLLALVVVGLGVFGVRSGRLRIGGVLVGWAAHLLFLVLTVALCWVVWQGTVRMWPDFYRLSHNGAPKNGTLHYFAFCLLALAVFWMVSSWFGRWSSTFDRTYAALLAWWALDVVSVLFWPGATFLTTWPTLFASLGLAWAFVSLRRKIWYGMALVGLAAWPALVLHLPVQLLSFKAFPTAIAPYLMVPFGAVLALLTLPLDTVAGARFKVPAIVTSGLAAAFLVVWAGLNADFDLDSPRPDNVFYALDADRQEAHWASFDRSTDEWTRRFFEDASRIGSLDGFPTGSRLRISTAPVVDLPQLQVRSLGRRKVDAEEDELSLRIEAPEGFWRLFLQFEAASPVAPPVILGNPPLTGEASARWRVDFQGPPDDGLTVVLRVPVSETISLRAIGYRRGLPKLPQVQPRPPQFIPAGRGRWVDSNSLVGSSYEF